MSIDVWTDENVVEPDESLIIKNGDPYTEEGRVEGATFDISVRCLSDDQQTVEIDDTFEYFPDYGEDGEYYTYVPYEALTPGYAYEATVTASAEGYEDASGSVFFIAAAPGDAKWIDVEVDPSDPSVGDTASIWLDGWSGFERMELYNRGNLLYTWYGEDIEDIEDASYILEGEAETEYVIYAVGYYSDDEGEHRVISRAYSLYFLRRLLGLDFALSDYVVSQGDLLSFSYTPAYICDGNGEVEIEYGFDIVCITDPEFDPGEVISTDEDNECTFIIDTSRLTPGIIYNINMYADADDYEYVDMNRKFYVCDNNSEPAITISASDYNPFVHEDAHITVDGADDAEEVYLYANGVSWDLERDDEGRFYGYHRCETSDIPARR